MSKRMKTLILSLLALSFTTCAPCTLLNCNDELRLEVRAPDGAVVDHFRGTVTIDGEGARFECPAEQEAEACVDAGVIIINLNTIGRSSAMGRNIGLRRELGLSVTAHDGGLGWSGSLTSLTAYDPNGPGCGPPCIAHGTQVQLEVR